MFGKHGTPEYECGVLGFPDFLEIMSKDSSLPEEERDYYKCCCEVKLERQVGKRYFITVANATKIVFLMKASIEFTQARSKMAIN